MKHTSLVKKLIQKGIPAIFTSKGVQYEIYKATATNRFMSWCVCDRGDIHMLKVRGLNDKDDFQSDYHAGAYYDSIKWALESFFYCMDKEPGECADERGFED